MTFKSKENYGGVAMNTRITLRETGSNNGVEIDVACSSDDGSSTVTYKIVGEADDNGGYIEVTFDDGTTEETYKETFSATGTNTGFCDDNTVSCTGFDNGSYDAPADLTSQLTITITGVLSSGNYVILPTGSSFDSSDPEPFLMSIVGMGYYNATDDVWEFADFFGPSDFDFSSCMVWQETESSGDIDFIDVSGQIGSVAK
jgi:hypothetical protein